MSATLEQVQTTTPATKALWAAVGVLGVAAVAMGAALVHVKTQPSDPSLSAVPTVQSLKASEAVVPGRQACVGPDPLQLRSAGAPQSAVQKAIKQASACRRHRRQLSRPSLCSQSRPFLRRLTSKLIPPWTCNARLIMRPNPSARAAARWSR
ncbi:MAG: hypothetical protein IPF71_11780 [Rhodoferax sp.]|nr:hypothetical protein [Rhodoferax sp.]